MIRNAKTKEAADLIVRLYNRYKGCGTGGYAHVVLDDWNLTDSHIDYCIAYAEKGGFKAVSEAGRLACIRTLQFMKGLTMDERYSALAISDEV